MTLHSIMKLMSLIRFDPMMLPLLFYHMSPLALLVICSCTSGDLLLPIQLSVVAIRWSVVVHPADISCVRIRIRKEIHYYLLDMHNRYFRHDRKRCLKCQGGHTNKRKYRGNQLIKPDGWRKFHLKVEYPFNHNLKIDFCPNFNYDHVK